MAEKKSKVKGTKVVDSCCAPVCSEYKPSLYLDLRDKDVSEVKGLTVGEKVQILVTGKVSGLSQRERADYDDKSKTVKTGSIDLVDYEIEVLADEDNEFKKLADDD